MGASTKVTSYIHAHVVFNMRHKEEKKKIPWCFIVLRYCFCDLFNMDDALSLSVLMKLLINNLINHIQPPGEPLLKDNKELPVWFQVFTRR